jgi:hypothetical protein
MKKIDKPHSKTDPKGSHKLENEAGRKTVRKKYSAPKLESFGDIREITLGLSNGMLESGSEGTRRSETGE